MKISSPTKRSFIFSVSWHSIQIRIKFRCTIIRISVFSPYHPVNHARIRLNDFDDLGRYVFFNIIRYRNSIIAVFVHFNRSGNGLRKSVLIYPFKNKAGLVERLRRSVEVRMQTAGNGCPIEVKKLDSSGSVPESETTAKAFICKWL